MTYDALLSSAPQVSRLLKAVGNDRRLKILCYLVEKERSVTELCGLIGIGQSALSQHLAKLRSYELVKTRRQSQSIYYSLASGDLVRLLDSLEALLNDQSDADGHNRGSLVNRRAAS